jgi:hypothetical protein
MAKLCEYWRRFLTQTAIISMCTTQSTLLKHEIYLIEYVGLEFCDDGV